MPLYLVTRASLPLAGSRFISDHILNHLLQPLDPGKEIFVALTKRRAGDVLGRCSRISVGNEMNVAKGHTDLEPLNEKLGILVEKGVILLSAESYSPEWTAFFGLGGVSAVFFAKGRSRVGMALHTPRW
jgi:hypothetical protein